MTKNNRVVIAGGGTGGHIYPGVAVAKALRDQGYDVHWVGAQGGLEEKIVAREGLPLHLIRIGKLHQSVGILTRIKTVFGLPLAFFQAVRLVLKLKPQAVLGVGGFASGPFLFVASLLGRRTVIWEPNAHAGMANRLLSYIVDECLLVFQEAASALKTKRAIRVGLPVRESMRPSKRDPMTVSGVSRPFRVLVFGGSQGARAINQTVADWIGSERFSSVGPNAVEVVHQTGRVGFPEISRYYEELLQKKSGIRVTCLEYLHDMDARYAWADLIVCRAGASTAAELAACAKAAVFIPLPTAADNHQLKNARVFEKAGAALVIEQKDLTVESLDNAVRRLQKDPVLVEAFEQAVRQFATNRAAETIAQHVIGNV